MKHSFLLFTFCFSLQLTAQVQVMTIRHACTFDDLETPNKEYYTFPGSEEATAILDQIMQVNVLEPNFTLRSGDCKNALATTFDGQRFILYSTTFLENFKRDANTKWAAYCVLAHEVGHHLNNDNLSETDPSLRRLYEIKADKFAGGVLYRLGATLDEAQAGIRTFSLEGGTKTHPPKSARLEALASGWKRAQEIDRGRVPQEPAQTETDREAETWYLKAKNEKDDAKAIAYFTKAIELKPDYVDAYNYRGNAKFRLDQYEEAILDYNKAIELESTYAKAYNNRGLAHKELKQNTEAIKDLEIATRLSPNTILYLQNLAATHYASGQYAESIQDYDRILAMDPMDTLSFRYRGNAKHQLSQYAEAILDFNKAIQLDPNNHWAFYSRGLTHNKLGAYTDALKDFDRTIQLIPENGYAYCQKGCTFIKLEKYHDAIEWINKGLRLNPKLDFAKKCLKEATSKL